MMKFILYMVFLIPLIFLNNMMWYIHFMLFFLVFIFLINNINSLIWMNLSYFFGCDFISYGLILLSLWICSLMFTASESVYRKNFNLNYFIFILLILLLFLLLTFSSTNLFMFYFFFESSLIPVLLLVLGWGYQSERLQAGIYLLFYTLFASLPLLLVLLYIYMNYYSLLNLMNYMYYNNFNSMYIYLCLILAFLVKMPMFLVHLWLPKAHVEAPISGSMILAGIMLKLGGYGLMRVYIYMMMMGMKYNYFFMVLSLLGGFIISLMCLFQFDLKLLIAYSSVVHMSMVISGIMTLTKLGFNGSYLMMISHGLCSSGLFCLVNVVYERSGSRSILLNKGLINFMPSMSLWWFLLCSSNMSAPPSLNLLSEIMLINSIISWNFYIMIMLIFLCFFSALYTLYLYSYSQHGGINNSMGSFCSGKVREYLLMFLHWFPLNFLIINVDLFIMI